MLSLLPIYGKLLRDSFVRRRGLVCRNMERKNAEIYKLNI